MMKIKRIIGTTLATAMLMTIPVGVANAAPPPVKKGAACYQSWQQGFVTIRKYTRSLSYYDRCVYNTHEYSIVGYAGADKYYKTTVYKV